MSFFTISSLSLFLLENNTYDDSRTSPMQYNYFIYFIVNIIFYTPHIADDNIFLAYINYDLFFGD